MIQNAAEAAGDLIGYDIADVVAMFSDNKITKVLTSSSETN